MAEEKTVQFKKKRKKNGFINYIYLFIAVFIIALCCLSYLVKSFSPDVDVEIGNKQELTLNESDMDTEIRTIDERLKWIQQEDEMQSSHYKDEIKDRETNSYEDTKENEEPSKKVIPMPKKPDKEIIEKQIPDFRAQQPKPVIPAPITKVYLGNFSSLDEAMEIQQKVTRDIPETMPFIKVIRNNYYVQVGSFSQKEMADAFIQRLKSKGYNPHTQIEN